MLRIAAAPLEAGDGEGDQPAYLAMVSDITESRRLEGELRQAALHDNLTGLPNRALLLDRLEHALTRETRSTAVLFVDLDQFKIINDARGHTVGDELLVARRRPAPGQRAPGRHRGPLRRRRVPRRLRGRRRGARAPDRHRAAARPRRAVPGRRTATLHVDATVGIALSPSPSAEHLLRNADTAMYAAKRAGRGAASGSSTPRWPSRRRSCYELGADLRAALAADALELHYQPIVDLASGRIVGIEALARWNHPTIGAIPPDRFVALAERTGLSRELDRWAICAGPCARPASCAVRGALPADAYVAVNLSPRHLADVGLEEHLSGCTAAAGLAPEQVMLEITERAIMAEPEPAIALLRRLRERGFAVAVDDFGTGHSSLALPARPAALHAEDRPQLRRRHLRRPSARAIAASIVELARAVGRHRGGRGRRDPRAGPSCCDGLGCDDRPGLAVVRGDLARGGRREPRVRAAVRRRSAATSPPAEDRPGAAARRLAGSCSHSPGPAATSVRPPPSCLASYIAASARRSRSVDGVRRRQRDADADADRQRLAVREPTGSASAAWIRSATTRTAASSVSSQMIANSSPPSRADRVGGAHRRGAAGEPTSISSSSPASWPWLSLIGLKRSRSRKSTAVVRAAAALLAGGGHLEPVEEEVAVGQRRSAGRAGPGGAARRSTRRASVTSETSARASRGSPGRRAGAAARGSPAGSARGRRGAVVGLVALGARAASSGSAAASTPQRAAEQRVHVEAVELSTGRPRISPSFSLANIVVPSGAVARMPSCAVSTIARCSASERRSSRSVSHLVGEVAQVGDDAADVGVGEAVGQVCSIQRQPPARPRIRTRKRSVWSARAVTRSTRGRCRPRRRGGRRTTATSPGARPGAGPAAPPPAGRRSAPGTARRRRGRRPTTAAPAPGRGAAGRRGPRPRPARARSGPAGSGPARRRRRRRRAAGRG